MCLHACSRNSELPLQFRGFPRGICSATISRASCKCSRAVPWLCAHSLRFLLQAVIEWLHMKRAKLRTAFEAERDRRFALAIQDLCLYALSNNVEFSCAAIATNASNDLQLLFDNGLGDGEHAH